jgi:hypothetical protein
VGILRISLRDENEISWYLGAGTSTFFHSNFGRTLERAQIFSRNPSNKLIPVLHGAEKWKYIFVPREDSHPAYEMDPELLDRFGRVSRRMLAVERNDAVGARLLELWYGDSGCRWAHQANPGRLMCFYAHTNSGQTYLRSQTPVEGLRPDERLANLELAQRTVPTEWRASLLRRIRKQADLLRVRMWRSWNSTSWEEEAA